MSEHQRIHEYGIPNGFIGTHISLDQQQIDVFTEVVDQPISPSKDGTPLGGRTNVITTKMPGIGNIVLKPYGRGGAARYLFKDRYVNIGNCRAATEYTMLRQAMALGINIPFPVAYVQRGRLLYKCWLAMADVENYGTLVRLSQVAPEALAQWMPRVSEQIRRLINNRMLHVDLHPGNVLAGKDGRVYLIDFDKARFSRMSVALLKERYEARWERAVQKYRLDARRLKIFL